jgi:hypothetical protein
MESQMHQNVASRSAEEPAAKRAYSAPILTEFGTVARLVGAGAGTLIEGPNSTNSKRKPCL